MKIRSIKKIEKRSTSSCCPPSSSCCPPAAPALAEKPPCCGPPATTRGGAISEEVPGFLRWLPTAGGQVPQIATELTWSDHLGACKARWGIGRMHYLVPPGLYAIGTPDTDAPVLVTANYKMSYDILRHTLRGHNLWLLVLETFGVNVWCAAGKGTFGTNELLTQIKATNLAGIVNHRQLILPILGAPGVAAHEVKKQSGFNVRYGTIRAADLPTYLDNGMVTTPAMRELTFTLYERLVLLPVEIVHAAKSAAIITLLLFLLGFFSSGSGAASQLIFAYLGALYTGIVVGPLLLPWLPGRSFAVKGASIGLLWALLCFQLVGADWNIPQTLAAFLALPAVSAFYTLNFTGCTTYTSPNGVKKEMRLAMPLMGMAILVSGVLLAVGQWLTWKG
ncbi:MAG: mercury methylation corrinoid protein HgcA [Desulfuromonadales bacterium]|nr:mercury methylation corrinoid protein HgcA [Desulfuromonadales bacterium]